MRKDEMELEIGKFYKNRRGEVKGPISKAPYSDDIYPFFDGATRYSPEGCVSIFKGKQQWDLIEEVPAPDTQAQTPYFAPDSRIVEECFSDEHTIKQLFDVPDEAYWREVRVRAAIAAMPSLLSQSVPNGSGVDVLAKGTAEACVFIADALVAELRKEKS